MPCRHACGFQILVGKSVYGGHNLHPLFYQWFYWFFQDFSRFFMNFQDFPWFSRFFTAFYFIFTILPWFSHVFHHTIEIVSISNKNKNNNKFVTYWTVYMRKRLKISYVVVLGPSLSRRGAEEKECLLISEI